MNFSGLSRKEKEKALMLSILETLQEFGGQSERTEIKENIISQNDDIAEFANKKFTSKKTGNTYSKFEFVFNFALKNLMIAGFLEYTKRNPIVTLTTKGMDVDLEKINIEQDIYSISDKYWEDRHQEYKTKKSEKDNISQYKETEFEEDSNDEISLEEQYKESFREKLLEAISKMSPKKFEMFSRLLLNKMGVEFTNKGVQVSNDGGIDGYGYHRDLDDFRTTRVVIQCKRYNSNDVGSPEIDRFLGAMNKFQADYGIFITNSRYSKAAQEASRAGTPITLIDGNDLVRLVIKYQLHIKPIQTYELLDFYNEE